MHSALLAIVLSLPACSAGGGEDLGPAATLGTAPTTTTTAPEPVDPAVIPANPADIDEAYLQAVVDALFAVQAQAAKVFIETGQLDERGLEFLRAIYVGDELDQRVHVWSVTLAEGGADTLRTGGLVHDITEVFEGAQDCAFVAVQRDYSRSSTLGTPPRTVYLGFQPKTAADDPQQLNPTAWMMFTDGFNEDGSQPENPCTEV